MKRRLVEGSFALVVATHVLSGCAASSGGNGALLVRREAKVFANETDRLQCGGDYGVTVWVDADEPRGGAIHVRDVTFSADLERDIAHAQALEISSRGRTIDRISEMIVRSDERGRTFVTFPVHRTFSDPDVSLRHVVAPSAIVQPANRAPEGLLARCGLTVATTVASTGGTR